MKGEFNLIFQADTTNANRDASWMIAFQWTGQGYTVYYRSLDYLFESQEQTAFYFDNLAKQNFDYITQTVIKDQINVLGVNNMPKKTKSAIITIATVNGSGGITKFNVVDGGAGYVSTPTISASIGSAGAFVPVLRDGKIVDVIIVSPGTGYNAVTSVVSIDEPIDSSLNYVSIPLGKDYLWQVDSSIIEPDGYQEPKKVIISFFDAKNDGQIDDPDAFANIVDPTYVSPSTGALANFVYFERLSDGLRYRITDMPITAYATEADVVDHLDGELFYFYSTDVVKSWSTSLNDYVLEPTYFAKVGRSGLKFQYTHNSAEDRRIDPAKTNIIDIYMLTASYDTSYRNWLTSGSGTEPLQPTSNSLEQSYSSLLEPIKSVSDTIIYHPAKYKVLFGTQASGNLQATFKAVRNSATSISDNELKTGILTAINEFFSVENWDFGQSFNFGELATYVMNQMTPYIVNFVLVPKTNIVFGSLFEVSSQSDEIFISGAKISDIEIIDSLTASQINATSNIVINTVGT